MILLRGIAGLIIGIAYGGLMAALIFLAIRVQGDAPGPMIPDNYGWGQMVLYMITLIATSSGAMVGLVVSLSGLNKIGGAVMGLVVGLGVLIYLFWGTWTGLNFELWSILLIVVLLTICFVLFPVGLALTGMLVSLVSIRLKQIPHKNL
jgi:hypothetical protein